MRRSRRRISDRGFEAWGFENLIGAFFKCFVFAPFRLARYNLVPDFEKYSVGKMIIDYLVVGFICGLLGVLSQFTAIIILLSLVFVPLILGITVRTIQKYYAKKDALKQQIVEQEVENQKTISSETTEEQPEKYDPYSATLRKTFSENQVGFETISDNTNEFLAPDFTHMDDETVLNLIGYNPKDSRIIINKKAQKVQG